METIIVCGSQTYPIHIGAGLLPLLGDKVRSLGGVRKVCIVSDSNVFPIYGRAAADSLQKASLETVSFIFSAGEDSKNPQTLLNLLNFLAENHFSRADLLVALGGGVVGDLAGFAAAVYLRGIRFVQVPTTLLAAVDSSVGGKTGIDLPAGKNLCGAFHQPSMVLCDTATLATLPEDIFRDGCAEVIKYAVLFDPALFSLLLTDGLNFDREAVISRCVSLKKEIVEQDERESGLRRLLNFGHTIGHGIEAGSHYSLSHGKSVSMGMAVVVRAAYCKEYCTQETRDRILSLLSLFGLPVTVKETSGNLFSRILSDKKRSGDHIHMIIPRTIGHCEIIPVPLSNLPDFIEAGLK